MSTFAKQEEMNENMQIENQAASAGVWARGDFRSLVGTLFRGMRRSALEDSRGGPVSAGIDALGRLLDGAAVRDVAEEDRCTPQTVRNDCSKAIAFLGAMPTYDSLRDRVRSLERDNAALSGQLGSMASRVTRAEDDLDAKRKTGFQPPTADERESLKFLMTPVSELSLKTRARNVLGYLGCSTAADVVGLSDEKILGGRNSGRKTLYEIRELLERNGFKLGDGERARMLLDRYAVSKSKKYAGGE